MDTDPNLGTQRCELKPGEKAIIELDFTPSPEQIERIRFQLEQLWKGPRVVLLPRGMTFKKAPPDLPCPDVVIAEGESHD